MMVILPESSEDGEQQASRHNLYFSDPAHITLQSHLLLGAIIIGGVLLLWFCTFVPRMCTFVSINTCAGKVKSERHNVMGNSNL